MDIEQFMHLLSATRLYQSGHELALFIAATITPALLVITIGIRTLETQVDALVSGGRWGRFVKDLGVWVTMLSVYFLLAAMVNEWFMALYESFSRNGSLASLMAQFDQLLEKIKEAGEGGDFFDGLSNLISSPILLISYLVYYVSLILVAVVASFLQIAHALAYAFAVSWGLIAIPLAITANLNILKAWARFSATVLVWPVFHYIAFGLFEPIFVGAGASFTAFSPGSITVDKAQVYMWVTIVNFVVIALLVATPFLAHAFIAHGAITGMVMPFVGASLGATGLVLRGAKGQAVQGAKAATGSVVKSANEGRINQVLASVASAVSPTAAQHRAGRSASLSPKVLTPQAKTPSAPSASQVKNTPPVREASAEVKTPSESSPRSDGSSSRTKPALSAKEKQRRRGVILQQKHKKGEIDLKGKKP